MSQDEQKDRQWLKKLLKKPGVEKGKFSFQYVIMLLCLGIGFMVVGSLMVEKNPMEENATPVFNENEEEVKEQPAFGQKSAGEQNSMEDYEIRYENQLKESLEQIVGLSDVTVMINLAETERYVYETNTSTKQQNTNETDREGGTRKVDDLSRDEQVVIVRNGDKEEPVLIRKEKPQIRGVLVVAQGVEQAQVKAWVVEAVSRVLDVPAHRVSVMPKKMKEES
ncbi:stage III sporulation protein AG [Halalkalibacterium ligniniphilum]|uniref:stage III sporulation protein AG n=1 Tax=Halalkalibacterium ligniniphilum TaxID=1134413 RepID=UPI00034AA68C|nr:stage III sporulation protein AG [Halalkalibacterium ligniniphilum]